MGHAWKSERKLRRRYRVPLTVVELSGPVFMGVSPFLAERYAAFDPYLSVTMFTLALVTLVSIYFLNFYQRAGSPHKKYFEVIMSHLHLHLWDDVLCDVDGAPHQQRLTFFETVPIGKFRSLLYRGKYSHRLVPRTRLPSGGRRPKRCWKIHEHNEDHCEGFAGQIFAAGGKICISKRLPDLHSVEIKKERQKFAQMMFIAKLKVYCNRFWVRLGLAKPKPPIAKPYVLYARRTQDEPVRVESERYYARIIGGVAILKEGRRLGILVLDSPDPGCVNAELFQTETMGRYLKVLRDVL